MVTHNWIKVVERRGQSVLISSYFYNGIQAKYFKKMLGLAHGLDHGLVLDYSYYYDPDDFAACKKEIAELLNKTQFGFLKQSFEKIYAHGKKILAFSEKIGKEKDNLGCFKKFSELCLEFGPALYFPVLVEELVENKIKQIMKKNSIPESLFVVLTSSPKPTDGSNELVNLHRLAFLFQKNNLPPMAIKDHLATYGWLSYTKFVGEQWTEASIRNRIADIVAHKNVAEEIKHLETIYTKNEEETKKIFKKYSVSSADQEIIRLAQELAYIRTYRIDVYTKAGFHAKQLFAALAHQLGITPEEFVFLTYEEIITLLENGKKAPRDIIKKRKNQKWQLKFINGTMTFAYENFELTDAALEQNEVRGNVAFMSSEKVRGTAKIIRGVLEFSKMEKGDILITSMTTPDFVPLMEKAAAIVTDEGGITSHAAIVSRELKKPCVIGTKFATKVFKDGDVVEVDAVNGIVRRIK